MQLYGLQKVIKTAGVGRSVVNSTNLVCGTLGGLNCTLAKRCRGSRARGRTPGYQERIQLVEKKPLKRKTYDDASKFLVINTRNVPGGSQGVRPKAFHPFRV